MPRIHAMERMKVDIPEGARGGWRVERRTITKHDEELQRLRAAINFSHRYPKAGTYTGLLHDGRVVMSDTDDEKRDHLEPVWQAERRGREGPVTALVNGLGLGMVVVALLSLESTAHVTVIEKAPEVIYLVGRPLRERYPGRLTIIEADALEWSAPRGQRFTVAWHDIWPTISTANLPSMHRLHRKYGRRCDWQGSWARGIIEAMRDGRPWL